jgi:transcriptional regulator CtsR
MPRLSDIIEEFIKRMFEESGDAILEIQRNELASHFGCAPSQINYVLMTRFNTDKGYYIESKRGGGGSIRITRVSLDSNDYLRHLLEERIGDTITQGTAQSIIDSFLENGLITERESVIMKSVVNDKAIGIQFQERDYIRAGLLKSMLLVLVNM